MNDLCPKVANRAMNPSVDEVMNPNVDDWKKHVADEVTAKFFTKPLKGRKFFRVQEAGHDLASIS